MAFERMDGERSLASEPAELFNGGPHVAGRLYVTDRRVVFESRLLRNWRESAEILLDDITDAYPRTTFWDASGMEILTRDGTRYRFAVQGHGRLLVKIADAQRSAACDCIPEGVQHRIGIADGGEAPQHIFRIVAEKMSEPPCSRNTP